jgi:hypothetical protein
MDRMRWRERAYVLPVGTAVLLGLVAGGCSSIFTSSSGDMYPYRATTGDCNCQHFTSADPQEPVRYEFTATYSVDTAITTEITVVVHNGSPDTLDMSLGAARVTSRNVRYRYNDRFVPIMIAAVPPHDQRTLTLVGSAAGEASADPWLPIAGERLVLTIKGLRLRAKELATQTVQFVPSNPKFSESQ